VARPKKFNFGLLGQYLRLFGGYLFSTVGTSMVLARNMGIPAINTTELEFEANPVASGD